MVTTLKQKTVSLTIEADGTTRSVIVRRMAWKPAREFSAGLLQLLSSSGAEQAQAGDQSGGALRQLIVRLPQLLSQSESLVQSLLLASTNLDEATIDRLDLGIVLELIRIAVETNLDDEVKNSSAGIAAAVVGLVPAPAKKTPTT